MDRQEYTEEWRRKGLLITIGGLTHSPKEWMNFASNIEKEGESPFAMRLYLTIAKWADENNDKRIKETCASSLLECKGLDFQTVKYKDDESKP